MLQLDGLRVATIAHVKHPSTQDVHHVINTLLISIRIVRTTPLRLPGFSSPNSTSNNTSESGDRSSNVSLARIGSSSSNTRERSSVYSNLTMFINVVRDAIIGTDRQTCVLVIVRSLNGTSCMSTSGYNFVLETFDSNVSCLTEGINGVVLSPCTWLPLIQLSSIVGKVVTTHCQVPGSNGEDVDDVIDTILVIASRNTKCRSSLSNTRQSVIGDSVSYDSISFDRRFDVSTTTRSTVMVLSNVWVKS